MLDLDPGMVIWAWITFVVLLIILYKVAWKPILSTIDKREDSIKDSIEQADNARQEAETLLQKHQEMMQTAEAEAQKLIRENKELAEKSRQELVEKARSEAQNIIEKARAEIGKEKESALAELRSEVADLAIAASRQIIGESLDEQKQRTLVENFIEKMPKSTKH